MGFVPHNLDQSFGQDNDTVLLGTYTNDGSTVSRLKSVTFYLGSAKITGFGTDGTLDGHNGDGSNISVTLCINGNSTYSSTQVVTTTITNFYSTSTGNYPDKSQCAAYTFRFNNSPAVSPGESVSVYWTNRSSLTSSKPGKDGTGKGQILTIASAYDYTDGPGSHTVTWIPNGGRFSDGTTDTKTVSVEDGESTAELTVSRTGYTYVWSPSGSYSTANLGNVKQDMTFTAVWTPNKYTVAYKANGGTGAPDSQTKTYGVDLTLRTGIPTRTGYTFKGWATTKTATSAIYQPGGTYTDNKDVTLYAVWDVITGSVTFYMNTSSGDTDEFYKAENVEYINKKLGQVKKSSNPVRPGYKFEGWSLTRTGQVESDDLSLWNSSTNKPRTKFYAIWSVITGPVTFYRNYDASDMTIVDDGSRSDVAYIKKTLGSIKPGDPTRLGYKFLGWALTRTGSVKSSDLSLWDTSANKPITVFYAIWEKLYTVWVRVNGIWVKKLNVRKYQASSDTWEEMPPRTRSSGTWEDDWGDKL